MLNIEALLVLLVGSGGIGALLNAWFTRRSSKESTEIDLLDRAYKEINRLDEQIKELEEELKKEKATFTESKK